MKNKRIQLKNGYVINNNNFSDRENRLYNGLPSQLMNDIYDGLVARDDRIVDNKYWPILSLYLARVCKVLEYNGWNKNE